jgi:DNA-binding NarL/FixJ family response regulator
VRIVLIDDNRGVRETVAEMLTRSGHEIIGEADNGVAGVQLALDERPNLVVTDWRMPEVDGIEATRRIRGADPTIEVIAFCSTDSPAIHGQFLSAGAWASIDKRDPRRLLAAVLALEESREEAP